MDNAGKETLELNKTQGKEHSIPCGTCRVTTVHKVLVSTDLFGNWATEEVSYWSEYQVVQCQGCKSISFRKNYGHTDDYETIQVSEAEFVNQPVNHEEFYPARIVGRSKLSRCWLLPRGVSNVYDETHAALCNKMYILAGIGIGVLVEAVCKEKNATGQNLEKKIEKLVEMGILTRAAADILHSLRALRNEAAHSTTSHEIHKLEIALDAAENLLQNVYILPALAMQLRKKNDEMPF